MSLGSALVDRAFVLRQTVVEEGGGEEEVEGTPVNVEGTPVHELVEGPEFKARLQIASATERSDDGLTQAEPRPMLLTAKKDSEGNKLEFRISDRVKVVSKELGTAVWEIDAEPEPMRKRKPVIGWQLQIHRVEEG